MKTGLLLAFLLCVPTAAIAQQEGAETPQPTPIIHHAVSSNVAAQAAFDRGLLDYYAYNPEAANHEFYTAADLDPKMAMAWWGIALSDAPDLNVPATDDRNNQARYAIVRAKMLEATLPRKIASLSMPPSRDSTIRRRPRRQRCSLTIAMLCGVSSRRTLTILTL